MLKQQKIVNTSNKLLKYLFPRYEPLQSTKRTSILLSSLLVILIEAFFAENDQDLFGYEFLSFHLSSGLALLFIVAVRYQIFEFVFIASYLLCNAFRLLGDFRAVSLCLSVLLIVWLVRSWIIPAITLLILDYVISVAVTDYPDQQIFASYVTTVLVLVLGFTLRKLYQNFAAKRLQAKEAAARTRHELAQQLHDTIAKDLAHVTILAQDFSKAHPELAPEIRPLVDAATSASQRLQPMILCIDTAATDTKLSAVIQQVTAMLKTRNITLDITSSPNVDGTLTRQQAQTGALALRECGANILKYAPVETHADLVVDAEAQPGVLTISISNEIAPTPQSPAISSGFGLNNLSRRISDEGGTMEITHLSKRWVVYITLPANSKPDTP